MAPGCGVLAMTRLTPVFALVSVMCIWVSSFHAGDTAATLPRRIHTLKLVEQPGSPINSVTGVSFSPDGKTLATSGRWGKLKLWDVATGKEKSTLANNAFYGAVSFSPDGRFIGAVSGTILIYDVATSEVKRSLTFSGTPAAFAFTRDSKTIITDSGSDDTKVIFWDIESREQRTKLGAHKAPITAVAVSPDGKLLATGDKDGWVRVWDLQTLKEKAVWEPHPTLPVTTLTFSPDSAWLVAGSRERNGKNKDAYHHRLQFFDLAAGKPKPSPMPVLDVRNIPVVQCVRYSPNGKLFALGADMAPLLETKSGKPWGDVANRGGAILSLDFSPDSKLFAAGKADGTVEIWELPEVK